MTSHLNRDTLLTLKAATRRLIRECGGTDATAQITRVSRASLGNYQNNGLLDTFMPIDVVADLETDIGQAVVTRTLAECNSGYFTPVRRAASPGNLTSHLSSTGKEFADVFERAALLSGNGQMSEGHRQTLLREIEEAIGALVGLKDAVIDMPGSGGGGPRA